MKKLLLALLLVVFGCSPAVPEKTEAPTAEKSQAAEEIEIDWQPFSKDLLKVSDALGKPIFLFLTDDQCRFCRKMIENTLSHPVIVETINKKFIPTMLDVRENTGVASAFYPDSPYITVPKVIFLRQNANGQLTSVEAQGYLNVFRMMEVIKIAERSINKKLNEIKANEESPGKHQGIPAK